MSTQFLSLLPALPAFAQLSPSSAPLHTMDCVASLPVLRVKSGVLTVAFKLLP